MLREAKKELQRAGAKKIEIIRVPGASFVVAAGGADAWVIAVRDCLPGRDFARADSASADYIGRAVTDTR